MVTVASAADKSALALLLGDVGEQAADDNRVVCKKLHVRLGAWVRVLGVVRV